MAKCVALAAVNSPTSVTLSGESAALEELAAVLEGRGTFCRFLKVQYAFHSASMDPIRDELLAALEGIVAATGEPAVVLDRHGPPGCRAGARPGILVEQRPSDGAFRRRRRPLDRTRLRHLD